MRHSDVGTYSSHIRIHGWFYPYFSQSFTWGPGLCAKGADKFFPRRTRGGLTTIFFPGVSDVLLRHSLFIKWFFLSRVSHLQRKQQYLVYPSCIPSNSAKTFKLPHLNSSYLDFPNSSFMLSKLSFMLAAWEKEKEGNLFVLWNRTIFKITFDESMNKRH